MSMESIDNLIVALQRYGLVSPEQLTDLVMNLQSGFLEPDELASALVRWHWLTAYQAQEIVQGRGEQLTLGQYLLMDLLGQGGMGQIFKARHRRLQRIDAIKVIRPEHVANPRALECFQREVEAAARLAHPNIVTIYDAGVHEGRHFLAMEYVDGLSLSKLVRKLGPLPVPAACDYVAQAACGLQHALDRDLVHRDIKPSNLFLLPDRGLIKIMDMGLALLHSSAPEMPDVVDLARPRTVMGTPDYMAPEQGINSQEVDIRADIYSLGCTFYFLLSGQAPFPGGSPTDKVLRHRQSEPALLESLRADVPEAVTRIMRRMMAKAAEDRYSSPTEVADALKPYRG